MLSMTRLRQRRERALNILTEKSATFSFFFLELFGIGYHSRTFPVMVELESALSVDDMTYIHATCIDHQEIRITKCEGRGIS